MTDYAAFLATKLANAPPTGLPGASVDAPHLFPFQNDLVTWALRRGRAALFADTGLGKTRMQLTWADAVQRHTGGRVLILAPLSVARQTAAEGAAVGITVRRVSDGAECAEPGIYATNYDKLHRFSHGREVSTGDQILLCADGLAHRDFDAVILDESSVIKHHTAKTFSALAERFAYTPFKLCASATPSPNDYTELGTHAEFLGVCTRAEMLAEYFIHDGGDTSKWRVKKHARGAFWRWVASWAAMIRRPSDLGYDDTGYELPPLHVIEHRSEANPNTVREAGLLFAEPASTLTERREARRSTLPRRIADCLEVVNGCLGKKSTQIDAEPSIDPTRLSENEGKLKDAGTMAARTCETTTEPTRTNSDAALDSKELITSGGVRGTDPILNSASRPSDNQGNGSETIRIRSEISEQERTAYLSQIGNLYSKDRVADAPYVAAINPMVESLPSTSTTTTGQVKSAVCCARRATWGSASSAMIRTGSSLPLDTCGDRCEQWIIWCELNAEQDALARALGDQCVSIYGSIDGTVKELLYEKWARGGARVLITKPSIFGFGINMQHCARMAFVGVTDSFEAYYQATRRIWRFGQRRECHVHLFYNELEGDVLANLKRKGEDAREMGDELSAETRAIVLEQVRGERRSRNVYGEREIVMPSWMAEREHE